MARQRKPTNLHLTLERFAAPIVNDPQAHRGTWRQDFMPQAREVRLDLGCGKGSFLEESAQREPDVLFVGIDYSDTCIARCAEKAVTCDLPNVRLVIADADQVAEFFAPLELDRVYLNFNSPFPKKKQAHLRLSHVERLMGYRDLVGQNGLVELRTDNILYWRWSLEQLRIAGYQVLRQTEDLAAEPDWDTDLPPVLTSEYFNRTTERGAHVYALLSHPGPAPATWEQTAPLGLCEYLPEDLDDLDHIPYGMESTVENMRNRLAREQRRAAHQARVAAARARKAKGGRNE
ncbi:MAG: methyltransferase domain-containing protein [Coriobacteriia bacterium]|nr:methyltransferase domain-containing protein [Coriobacteriia bacterium]